MARVKSSAFIAAMNRICPAVSRNIKTLLKRGRDLCFAPCLLKCWATQMEECPVCVWFGGKLGRRIVAIVLTSSNGEQNLMWISIGLFLLWVLIPCPVHEPMSATLPLLTIGAVLLSMRAT